MTKSLSSSRKDLRLVGVVIPQIHRIVRSGCVRLFVFSCSARTNKPFFKQQQSVSQSASQPSTKQNKKPQGHDDGGTNIRIVVGRESWGCGNGAPHH
jgi:hypothetical protein